MATVVTKTIKPSGGDYSAVSTWEANEQRDLVALGEVAKGEISGFTSPLTDSVTIDGWTTDSDHFVWLTVADADRHDGTPGSGFKMTDSINFGAVVSVAEPHTIVEGLEIENAHTNNGKAVVVAAAGELAIIRDNILIAHTENLQSGVFAGGDLSKGPLFINNIILPLPGFEGVGIGVNFSSGFVHARVFNNTVSGKSIGFANQGTRPRWVNNVAFDNTTNYENPTNDQADDTNNASDDASTTDIIGGTNGSGVVAGVTASDFQDTVNDDFRLASGSILIDAGADLTTDFSAQDRIDYVNDETDAVGSARGAIWDIGAFEFQGGGQTISLGTAVDGVAAQGIGWAKSRALGAATDAPAAQALGRVKSRALTPAADAPAAQAVGWAKALALGPAIDAALAQALGRAKARALSPAVDAPVAQTVVLSKARAAGTATVQDVAQAIAVGAAVAVGVAVDAPAAQALAWDKALQLGVATAAESARPLGATKSRGAATATAGEVAVSVVAGKAVAAGTAADLAQALALALGKTRALGTVTVADVAQALAVSGPATSLQGVSVAVAAVDVLFDPVRRVDVVFDPVSRVDVIFDAEG